jgi:GNAT superfamily N-acetyltransferase
VGLTPVPPGHVAAVVTFLEMRKRPPARPLPAAPLRLARWRSPEPDKYRALFQRVGENWLWFSRLVMSDDALTAIIHDPAIEIYAVLDPRNIEIGLIELDFRRAPNCEIAFFGLIPELAGRQYGRWMMAQVMALGWRGGVERLWVHSCTLDHPSALGFYRAQGFTAYDRTLETFADPRLTRHLPRTAATQIPLIDPDSRA